LVDITHRPYSSLAWPSRPNELLLSRVSCTGSCLRELQKFLILILGYAVQCDRKEDHIEAIKSLDVDTQQALVMHIQQVGR